MHFRPSSVRFAAVVLLFVVVAGCQPAPERRVEQPIPTLASLPDAPLVDAERVARSFLDAWVQLDYPAMHRLITFSSRDATPLEVFVALYTQSADEMTLASLLYRGNALARDPDTNGAVALFNYDVTFNTRLLGSFDDRSRDLHLIYDDTAGDWRVAWSPADIFAEMGEGGRLRLRPILPPRANIYDRTGELALADQNGRAVVVNVIRDDIPDYPACLAALAAALNEPALDVQTRLEARPSNWLMDMGRLEPAAWELHRTPLETTCRAQFAGLPTRRYPYGDAFANVVGYVGYPDPAAVEAAEQAGFEQDSILGRSGVESSWDETLRGQPGGELSIVTPAGEVLREIITQRSAPPQSVWLTLDADWQTRIYAIVDQAYRDNAWAATSRGASVVLLEANTGRIRALVSYPSFDNNAFTPFPPQGRAAAQDYIAAVQADPRRPQLNRPTLGGYQLGSVMKLVSSIAVADSGTYALDERYTCIGVWSRDIPRVDWLAGGHGTITLTQAITRSCNPFYYEVGYRLDAVDPLLLPSYMREMNFGTVTGLRDLPEAPGLVGDPAWLRATYGAEWTFSEAVNLSIGQGYMEVTPLQVARMVSAIANDGTLYTPHLVEQVGLLGETPSYTAQPEVERQVEVKPEVLALVRAGMCDVTTTPLGTAAHIFRDSPVQAVGVCGKTGTAQAPGTDAVSHAWFASYAPRDNPEYVLIVMVENSGEGSGVAAPIARDVWELVYGFR